MDVGRMGIDAGMDVGMDVERLKIEWMFVWSPVDRSEKAVSKVQQLMNMDALTLVKQIHGNVLAFALDDELQVRSQRSVTTHSDIRSLGHSW